MTVYIEYVIVDNLIIDYCLLKATFFLTGKPVAKGRLLFCAILGALGALFFPLVTVNSFILILLKVAFGLLLVLLSANFQSFRSFYLHALIFFSLTFLLGGALIGVFSLLGVKSYGEVLIAVIVVPAYILLKGLTAVVKYLYRKKDVVCAIVEVDITLCEKTVKGRGFFDTGNELYDKDRPVIVCGKSFFKKLITDKTLKVKFKKIQICTVSGESINLAVNLEQIKIYNGQEVNIYNNVTLVVSKHQADGYDVILHPALMGDNYVKKSNGEIKEVS